jgi:hypothetical protein
MAGGTEHWLLKCDSSAPRYSARETPLHLVHLQTWVKNTAAKTGSCTACRRMRAKRSNKAPKTCEKIGWPRLSKWRLFSGSIGEARISARNKASCGRTTCRKRNLARRIWNGSTKPYNRQPRFLGSIEPNNRWGKTRCTRPPTGECLFGSVCREDRPFGNDCFLEAAGWRVARVGAAVGRDALMHESTIMTRGLSRPTPCL